MAWLSISDIVPGLLEEQHLIQLTQDAVDATEADTDVVNAQIALAESEVEGYLAARYTTPLATTPALVLQLGARIFLYRLKMRRPGAVSEELRGDYKAAVATLRDISNGIVVLSVPEPSPNPERLIRRMGRARVFGRGNLESF